MTIQETLAAIDGLHSHVSERARTLRSVLARREQETNSAPDDEPLRLRAGNLREQLALTETWLKALVQLRAQTERLGVKMKAPPVAEAA